MVYFFKYKLIPHLIVNENLLKKSLDQIIYKDEFFTIKKNDIDYSLDIIVDINILQISDDNIKKKLLFFLKCYISEKECLLKLILLIGKSEDDKICVNFNIKIKKISKFTLYDFIEWIDEVYHEERYYFKDSKYIGFRLIFYKESISWKMNKILPNIELMDKIM